MFKNVSRIISVIALLSILLAACGTTATPATQAPAKPATQAPAVPVLVSTATQAPAAPAATEGAAPAAGTNWCSGTKIVFFPGGTAGGGFEQVVYNGAVQAAKDTGADVQYVWSDWDPAKMTTQFTQAVATKPDGIAVMGHPGDAAFDPLIADAEKQGIIVTSMNTQLPLAQAQYQSNGFGYSGAILYSAGYALGQEAVKRSGVKAGDKAFLWGLLAQAGRGERTKGVKDALEKAGLKVIYQEIDDATNKSAAAGVPIFTGIFSKDPDIKLVVTDHGNLTGVLQICLTKNYGFGGLQIDTGAGFADKNNIDQLSALVTKQIR